MLYALSREVGKHEAIGRYSVVGQLAIGGTAEILLGRLGGPNRFERLVVIKRLLPQLAQKAEFRGMFLDEARIAARIRHPNVVQVQELVDDGRELYLAMEYLEGESVSNLLRRCVAQGRRVPHALTAFIVAEACAGLHAAHSLTDANGELLQLVHRDVSPQNVIVTYGGEVKILDFGIAKAANRITQTEAGVIKGKFLYMSPEQATAKPIDRRTDVFALGTVLYELATGRALFKRPSHAQVIKAICEDPVVPPSRVDPDIPKALERVCLKALARDREQRYDTAADMRKDLMPIVRELLPSAEAREELAALMKALFEDRALEKKEMLEKVEHGSDVTVLPTTETDEATDIPGVMEDDTVVLPSAHGVSSVNEGRSGPPPGARRSSRFVGLVVAVGLLATAVIVTAAVRLRAPPVANTASTRLPEARSVAPVESSPVAAADVPTVSIRIETAPPGALLEIDGASRGTTPVELRIPKDAAMKIELSKAGYATVSRSIDAHTDDTLLIRLAPAKKPGATHPTARPRASSQPTSPSPTPSPSYRFDRF